jgi:hypothetical protein
MSSNFTRALRIGIALLGTASALLGGIQANAQSPLKPGFDVVNASALAIQQVFAKPDGSPNWGSPLPNAAVAAGKTGSIKVPNETNCKYDVRLVFADGTSEEHDKVDVCKHDRIETTSRR